MDFLLIALALAALFLAWQSLLFALELFTETSLLGGLIFLALWLIAWPLMLALCLAGGIWRTFAR